MRSVFAFITLMFVFVACFPYVADTRPEITIINGPREFQVKGLADEFEDLIERDPFSAGYQLTFSPNVRFQESHRDLRGSRANLQAAFIARVYRASYAVMISAPEYRREVYVFENGLPFKREVEVTVRLQVIVVDPETATPIRRFQSSVYKTYRLESHDIPLAELEDDKSLKLARQKALEEISPLVVTELAVLISEQL